jgi:hypothetical protein
VCGPHRHTRYGVRRDIHGVQLLRRFARASLPLIRLRAPLEAPQNAFWNNPGLPESKEADQIMAGFFDKHLGK